MPENSTPQIWVIDRHDHLRNPVVQTLGQEGFNVRPYKNYSEVPSPSEEVHPDLVLLGCLRSSEEETKLVEHLSRQGRRVLILISSPSLAAIRALFLCGARDVADRPHSGQELLSLVKTHLGRPAL